MILTDEQLRELTRKQLASAQCRVLDALGIPYRRRPDGSIVVFEADLHATKEKRSPPPKLRLSPTRSALAGQAR